MALVSVVIPTHNRSKYIERAIASVLAQTYADLEAIVVDDGSADDTARVAEAYARKDSRIRLIQHERRKGAQAARNTGIFAATGKWIAFLDSDDEWLHDSLALRLKAAEKGKLQIIHSECYVANGLGAELRRFGLHPLEGWVYESLLQKPGTLFPSLLVTKECLERIGYLDERIVSFQEWDTSIRLARHYPFGFVAEPTFVYDCRQEDSISKDMLRQAQGYEQVFKKHFSSIFRCLGHTALVAHYQQAAYLYAKANNQNNARRCSRNAFLCWPFQPREILNRVQRFFRIAL
jgi:glycosyltransferase involved in cell wall biosynthesis